MEISTIKRRYGFTLVELMVTITIIGILVTVGVAGYSRFNQTQTLRTAANDLKNNLRLAQNKALSQQKPSGCTCLSGYQVVISSSSYQMQAFCDLDPKIPCGPTETFTMPTRITLSPSLTVYFYVLEGGAEPAAITVSGFGKTPITVTVKKTGEIY